MGKYIIDMERFKKEFQEQYGEEPSADVVELFNDTVTFLNRTKAIESRGIKLTDAFPLKEV